MSNYKRAFLIILDGWGIGQVPSADAILQAETPYTDELFNENPHSTLTTHGEQVGLPQGQMGNSEVGHMNIGAGRIVYQDLLKINRAIDSGDLVKEAVLDEALKLATERGCDLHLIGLISDGGVHSHSDHAKALIDYAQEAGVKNTYLHAFMDGRDTDPRGGLQYLQEMIDHMEGKRASLASIIGRYYAMDRDRRWHRTKLAYDLLVKGTGEQTADPLSVLATRYEQDETDEFLKPISVIEKTSGKQAVIKDGDVVIFFNFRADRPRQITEMLVERAFEEEDTKALDLHFVTMTLYDKTFANTHIIYPKAELEKTLGEIIADKNLRQLRAAETEKYPHVTYFFSGGREKPFENEDRILAPSPKVATYDLKPSMSAVELTDAVMERLEKDPPDFICLNYANTDMVGHTGVFSAAMEAAHTVDTCLSRLIPLARQLEYEIIIIADHGNSDFLINEDGSPNTAHSMNPVPCVYVGSLKDQVEMADGILADVAPTLAKLMGLEEAETMEGNILMNKK